MIFSNFLFLVVAGTDTANPQTEYTTFITQALKKSANMICASYDDFHFFNLANKDLYALNDPLKVLGGDVDWLWAWNMTNSSPNEKLVLESFLNLQTDPKEFKEDLKDIFVDIGEKIKHKITGEREQKSESGLGTMDEWQLLTKYQPGGRFGQELGIWEMSRNYAEEDYLAMMFKNAEKKENIFVFRGTDVANRYSGLQNFKFKSSNAEYTTKKGAEVHGGFKEAFEHHKKWINEKMSTITAGKENIIITGHSQGGALAYLAAMYIADNFPGHKDNLTIMTYATAIVGNSKFSEAFDEKVGCENTFHFKAAMDLVPHLGIGTVIPCSNKEEKYNFKKFTTDEVNEVDKGRCGWTGLNRNHCPMLLRNLVENWLSNVPAPAFTNFHPEGAVSIVGVVSDAAKHANAATTFTTLSLIATVLLLAA